ncbi:MAG: DnaJ domain-containing protein, partial [Candidatus Poribacteria bacterium]
FDKIDDISLHFIGDNDKKHISNNGTETEFDFSSESIPFSAKYNIAFAISYSEAIGILSSDDDCEIYASEEIKKVFAKYGVSISDGINRANFRKYPLEMRRDLIWPTVQNLYRALTIRKACQIFPEGVHGKIAYDALMADCKNDELSVHLSQFSALKYSDYETIYFSDPSDLEMKYHIALYCLEHVSEIKPKKKAEDKKPDEDKEEDEKEPSEDEQSHEEKMKSIEDEYISAFKRLNKNKSFWEKINFSDILEMGKDVLTAITDEVRFFAKLKQEIFYRLGGKSKVMIEDNELFRIILGQNPNFEMASQYLGIFFQPCDYYNILGIKRSKSLTEKEVKDAFKKLAKIYHPDKNPNDPYKDEKEQRFKLMLEAKDALLKTLKSGKDSISGFRDDASLSNYLGNISGLFDGLNNTEETNITKEEKSYQTEPHQTNNNQEANRMEKIDDDIIENADENITENISEDDEYLGPYYEEMRMLESLAKGWKDKDILILGAGRVPEDFSIPVILTQMGANVFAVDINYNGPEEYRGCHYYRVSIDRVDQVFNGKQFDIMISTAVFGVPFTNWAIKQYSLNPFGEGFRDRIRQLELEVFEILARATKKGGWHFHFNKDLNPQSWNWTENDLKKLGYESAFHPENMENSKGIYYLKA